MLFPEAVFVDGLLDNRKDITSVRHRKQSLFTRTQAYAARRLTADGSTTSSPLEVVAGETDKRFQRRRRLPVPHVSTSLVRTDADNPNNLRTLQVESQRRRPLHHTIEAQTTLVRSGSHRADPQSFDLSAFARGSFGKTRQGNRWAKGINPEPSPTTHARSDVAMVCGCMAHYRYQDP